MRHKAISGESRVKKSLLNARVNLLFYSLSTLVSFFSRKIFLNLLGTDFVGFTGTLSSLLGFLNLAELGIGVAVGYVLYKPLFNKEQDKINDIISVFGYLYRWIGRFILFSGVLLSLFLPHIFTDTNFETGFIYFAYFSFLSSSLLSYFINYKQILLGADQRNYVVTACFGVSNLVKVIVQMVLTYYTQNYYLWIAMELLTGIVNSWLLNWKIRQVYPWLKVRVKDGSQLVKLYPDIIKLAKQTFIHKMAYFVQTQTTPILIYSFVSLQTVAFYGNYTLIVSKLSGLFDQMLGSTGAGVGNLVAEGNRTKIISLFWELLSLRFYIAGIMLFSVYFLLPPFISIWIGNQYVMSDMVLIFILCNTFISVTRTAVEQFISGYGLYRDVWAPITESAISLLVSLVGGYYYGLEGILSGSLVSLLIIVCGWKPYFLFTSGFRVSPWIYLVNYLKHFLMMILTIAIGYFAIISTISIDPASGFLPWILYALYITLLFALLYALIMYLSSRGMRKFLWRFLMLLKQIK